MKYDVDYSTFSTISTGTLYYFALKILETIIDAYLWLGTLTTLHEFFVCGSGKDSPPIFKTTSCDVTYENFLAHFRTLFLVSTLGFSKSILKPRKKLQ